MPYNMCHLHWKQNMVDSELPSDSEGNRSNRNWAVKSRQWKLTDCYPILMFSFTKWRSGLPRSHFPKPCAVCRQPWQPAVFSVLPREPSTHPTWPKCPGLDRSLTLRHLSIHSHCYYPVSLHYSGLDDLQTGQYEEMSDGKLRLWDRSKCDLFKLASLLMYSWDICILMNHKQKY